MILSFLPLLISVNITIPKIIIPDAQEIINNTETMVKKQTEVFKKSAVQLTYKDSGFTNPTNNFSPGENIYIKVESQGSGDTVKKIKLLNSDKNLLEEKDLSLKIGTPNIFTAILKTPAKQGVYYINIDIKGSDGYTISMENNINVGSTNNASVNSSAVSISNSQNTISTASTIIVNNAGIESTASTQLLETKNVIKNENPGFVYNIKSTINNFILRIREILKL